MGKVAACGLENGLEVGDGLLGLRLNAALGEAAGGRVDGELTGREDQRAVRNGLRIRADGGRGVIGVNDLHVKNPPVI